MLLFAIICFFWFGAVESRALTDSFAVLSKTEIKKGRNFKGADIILTLKSEQPSHYVVEVEGPRVQYKIWQKEERFGMWTKGSHFTTKKVPSYQFIETDMSVRYIEDFAHNFSLDIYGRRIQFISQDKYSKIDLSNAIDAFFEKQKKNMHYIYRFNQDPMQGIIKINIPITERALTGDYNVTTYLLDVQSKIIKKQNMVIRVSKDDFYSKIEDLSQYYPFCYTILSVVLTFCIGLFSHLIFKR